MKKNIHKSVKGESEEALQQKCFFWFHNNYEDLRGMLFHVPNGGARNKREGARFKLLGVVPGVADLMLIYAGSVYCFELKNAWGKQSKVQERWQKKVEAQGIYYEVINNLEDFKNEIKKIIQ